MIGADFGMGQKNNDDQVLTQLIPESNERPREETKANVKGKKLAFLGRQVNESSDTEDV